MPYHSLTNLIEWIFFNRTKRTKLWLLLLLWVIKYLDPDVSFTASTHETMANELGSSEVGLKSLTIHSSQQLGDKEGILMEAWLSRTGKIRALHADWGDLRESCENHEKANKIVCSNEYKLSSTLLHVKEEELLE